MQKQSELSLQIERSCVQPQMLLYKEWELVWKFETLLTSLESSVTPVIIMNLYNVTLYSVVRRFLVLRSERLLASGELIIVTTTSTKLGRRIIIIWGCMLTTQAHTIKGCFV